jgi:hypothetical protein
MKPAAGMLREALAPAGPPRHGFRATIDRTEEAEGAACAMRKDVTRVKRGLPCHWVTVHEVARRQSLDDAASEAAVQQAIEHGRFIADGHPPHSIRLSAVAT